MSIPRSARNGEKSGHISIISGLERHKHEKCTILHNYSYILGKVLGRLFHAHTIHADHIINRNSVSSVKLAVSERAMR